MVSQERRVVKALEFLNNHPALHDGHSCHSVLSTHNVFCYEVCDHGLQLLDPVTVKPPHSKYYEYCKKLNRGKPEIRDEILLTHQQYYGTKWKFHHVEWGMDISIMIYGGDSFDHQLNDTGWSRYLGFTVYGKSFNDVILKAAKRVAKELGNFHSDDFLSTVERENHHKVHPFKWTVSDVKDSVTGEELYDMNPNPKYIDVTQEKKNRRWLRWWINQRSSRNLKYFYEGWVRLANRTPMKVFKDVELTERGTNEQ